MIKKIEGMGYQQKIDFLNYRKLLKETLKFEIKKGERHKIGIFILTD